MSSLAPLAVPPHLRIHLQQAYTWLHDRAHYAVVVIVTQSGRCLVLARCCCVEMASNHVTDGERNPAPPGPTLRLNEKGRAPRARDDPGQVPLQLCRVVGRPVELRLPPRRRPQQALARALDTSLPIPSESEPVQTLSDLYQEYTLSEFISS